MPNTKTPDRDLRPTWLDPDASPHALNGIDVAGHRISYTDTGSGPTLLLVHVGLWSFVWRDVVTRLNGRYRVVTLDAPTTGASQGPARPTLADAADAVDALVRALDLRELTLVCHDLGGPAALDAARRWPDRVHAVVAINSFGWRPHSRAFRLMLAVMGSTVMRELDVWTGWLPRASSTRLGVGRHWDRAARRTYRRALDHRGRRSFHRYLRSARTHDYTAVEDTVRLLRQRPLLTIFGERNDPLHFQPRWHELFPHHTRVVVAKGNHFPMCDDPALVADALTRWHGSTTDDV